jgi:hypothetical protein
MSDVVLKRIRDESIFDPNPAFALMMQPLIPQGRRHQLVEISVVRKLNVPADVPGESTGIGERCSQSADFVGLIVDVKSLKPQFAQPPTGSQPRWAGAENHNTLIAVKLTLI